MKQSPKISSNHPYSTFKPQGIFNFKTRLFLPVLVLTHYFIENSQRIRWHFGVVWTSKLSGKLCVQEASYVHYCVVKDLTLSVVICFNTDCFIYHRDELQGKHMVFSSDGSLFGWCNGEQYVWYVCCVLVVFRMDTGVNICSLCVFDRVSVVKVPSGELVKSSDLPKTAALQFSPLNNILATWQQYTSKNI